MNIPVEFRDYLVTESHLNRSEQDERFYNMHTREIRERATILRNLLFDKQEVKARLKSYIEEESLFFELPRHYKAVDKIVDEVYFLRESP